MYDTVLYLITEVYLLLVFFEKIGQFILQSSINDTNIYCLHFNLIFAMMYLSYFYIELFQISDRFLMMALSVYIQNYFYF
jgi:hypothetical protein